ncbi:MAG: hypothetical protein ACFB21_04815, partial [Opitutales bacterium]
WLERIGTAAVVRRLPLRLTVTLQDPSLSRLDPVGLETLPSKIDDATAIYWSEWLKKGGNTDHPPLKAGQSGTAFAVSNPPANVVQVLQYGPLSFSRQNTLTTAIVRGRLRLSGGDDSGDEAAEGASLSLLGVQLVEWPQSTDADTFLLDPDNRDALLGGFATLYAARSHASGAAPSNDIAEQLKADTPKVFRDINDREIRGILEMKLKQDKEPGTYCLHQSGRVIWIAETELEDEERASHYRSWLPSLLEDVSSSGSAFRKMRMIGTPVRVEDTQKEIAIIEVEDDTKRIFQWMRSIPQPDSHEVSAEGT